MKKKNFDNERKIFKIIIKKANKIKNIGYKRTHSKKKDYVI